MLVDNKRKCLYTLNVASEVQCIYLGKDGKEFKKIDVWRGIREIAKDQLMIEGEVKVISIRLVQESESNHIHLIGITSNGITHKIIIFVYSKVGEFSSRQVTPTISIPLEEK